MLQRINMPTREYAYLLSVEVQDGGPTEHRIVCALSDSLRFVEGAGAVDVTCLGLLETEEETPS